VVKRDDDMIEFTVDIDIDRPIGGVFDYLIDFENIPAWNPYVQTVKKVTAGPVDLGTRFHQVRRTDQQDYDITGLNRPHLIEVSTTASSAPPFVIRFELSSHAHRTKLQDTWKLDAGISKVLEGIARRQVRSSVQENLTRLKILLEST
jgi:uncharacterized protein YndB with AHSA1/START domain